MRPGCGVLGDSEVHGQLCHGVWAGVSAQRRLRRALWGRGYSECTSGSVRVPHAALHQPSLSVLHPELCLSPRSPVAWATEADVTAEQVEL